MGSKTILRMLRAALAIAALGGGLAMTARGVAAGQPCAISNGGTSPVAQACAEGGLIAAKRTMRELTKRARAAGTRFECEDCHKNDTGYDLTPQAREAFKRLLAAAGVGR
jgi:hypothetical protein